MAGEFECRIAVFIVSLMGLAVLGFIFLPSPTSFLSGPCRIGHPEGRPTNCSTLPSAAERPTDPFALGYRGDPTEALGLPFTTVTLETPLGPTEAWLVPAAGTEAGRAVDVHGIAGAREDGYRPSQTSCMTRAIASF